MGKVRKLDLNNLPHVPDTAYYIKTVGKPIYVHYNKDSDTYEMKRGNEQACIFSEENAKEWIKASGAENLMTKKVKKL
jgi:nitroimidazol reductase NimA-like FMN-containing flavoprotein (pyridoxamine 5'-phosphate oxidase superfamily)